MRNTTLTFLAFFLLLGILAACRGQEAVPLSTPPTTFPTATTVLIATATPAPSPTPLPEPTSTTAPTPTPTPSATSTPIPVPTQTPEPTLDELHHYMLSLINEARVNRDLRPVEMGSNTAAQAHADDMMDNCYSSHWNLRGLTPGTRYAFAGGFQWNQEVVAGTDYCVQGGVRNATLPERVRRVFNGWKGSPGHWKTITNPKFSYANIGLAWDARNFFAAIQFEGDFIRFTELPTLEAGILRVGGTLVNGAEMYGRKDLHIYLEYRPGPTDLTRGQLSRVYGMAISLRAVKVRTPPAPGNTYASDTYSRTRMYPLTPHEVDPEAHAPRSHGESNAFWEEAKVRPDAEITNTVHYATADVWDTNLKTGAFLVVADVSAGLRAYGPGIYELVIFAVVDGESSIVSEYAFMDDGAW